METTAGHLLGGQVVYAQPRTGFRTGIEPVLLAASVPARPGQRVLEAGSGAGAALLCLAARVPELQGVGVERDPALAALARQNAAANGFAARLAFVAGDIADFADTRMFDHALANPPWHTASGTASPVAAREAAKRASPGLLAAWARSLARRLHGSLSLILPAAAFAEGVAALTEAGCGALTLTPLWPKAGTPARLILLQGRKQARAPCRVLAGLTLHRPEGGYTEEAERILRRPGALPLDPAGGSGPQTP